MPGSRFSAQHEVRWTTITFNKMEVGKSPCSYSGSIVEAYFEIDKGNDRAPILTSNTFALRYNFGMVKEQGGKCPKALHGTGTKETRDRKANNVNKALCALTVKLCVFEVGRPTYDCRRTRLALSITGIQSSSNMPLNSKDTRLLQAIHKSEKKIADPKSGGRIYRRYEVKTLEEVSKEWASTRRKRVEESPSTDPPTKISKEDHQVKPAWLEEGPKSTWLVITRAHCKFFCRSFPSRCLEAACGMNEGVVAMKPGFCKMCYAELGEVQKSNIDRFQSSVEISQPRLIEARSGKECNGVGKARIARSHTTGPAKNEDV